eukprot:150387_1
MEPKQENDNTELINCMQKVFTSIGITLSGFLSIIEFYNIIQSGLFGDNWREIFSNNIRLSHYTSCNEMQSQIQRLIENDKYKSIDMEDYQLILGFVDINLDENIEMIDYLGYIVMYFIAERLFVDQTFAGHHKKCKEYIINKNKDTPNIKSYKFDLSRNEIEKYWKSLQTIPNTQRNIQRYNITGFDNTSKFSLRENDIPRYVHISLNSIESDTLPNDINGCDYQLFAENDDYSSTRLENVNIEHKDIINMILPNFIDNEPIGKYCVFDCYWGIIEAFDRNKGRCQFIFKQIQNAQNGCYCKYKMILNGAQIEEEDLGWSDTDTDQYYELYNSLLINHPLIGITLKEVYED